MEKTDERYIAYAEILRKELVPAMGCTEPIAIALCGAKARTVLGCLPTCVEVEASGNVIKNVKSVIVPHTGGMKGVEAAVAAGIVAGDAEKELETLASVTEEDRANLVRFLREVPIKVRHAERGHVLDVTVRVFGKEGEAAVRILGRHTNVVRIEKNGEILFSAETKEEGNGLRYDLLTVRGILDFADTAEREDFYPAVSRQLSYNRAAAEEGLSKDRGANIGKVLLSIGQDVRTRAKAWAAAGSDARMNGSELPVVINSGSGN